MAQIHQEASIASSPAGRLRLVGNAVAARAPLYPATEMFGREADLAVVIALVTGPHRLVTLTGRTGVGKTRLALEVLHAYHNLHRGPAAVVQLSVLADAGLVLPELASRLVVPFPPGQGVLDALAGGIGEDDLFLVLDNFEHVIAAAVSLGQLLERCPNLRVLATSQTPLHLRAERVVHLDPLPTPSPGDNPVDVRTNPAVQLYCGRAAAASRAFRFGPGNGGAIAELCRRLEGLPLAIELAAVRAGTLPVSEILTRLDTAPFDLLRQPQSDAPPRHHDLRAAIAWTYALLAPDEQRLLRRLSVTTGVFDIDAAAALDDEPIMLTINRVAALAELRLVDLLPETVPAQYSMPWSIRTFAREELERSGEASSQRRRYVVRAAERAREMAAGLESREADRWGETAAEEESTQLARARRGTGARRWCRSACGSSWACPSTGAPVGTTTLTAGWSTVPSRSRPSTATSPGSTPMRCRSRRSTDSR